MVSVDTATQTDGPSQALATDSTLAPYLPRLVHEWSTDPQGPRLRTIDGSLVSVDISGFTALAERLASKGRAGAEELVLRISSCFDGLIEVAERHGGDVLKFRGDALLLFFYGDRHAERAAGAASDMQWTIESIGSADSSVGPVELRMSAGVHSGECHFFLTETPHRELLVAGPGATRVFELEDLATAGEIVLSAETAAEVDPVWLGEEREGARVMHRLDPGASTYPPPPFVAGAALDEYVPAPLRAHLVVSSGEAEHRQVTVAFVKLSGTDELIASEGPAALLERIDTLAAAVGLKCETYGLTWLESDIDVGAVKLYLTGGAPSSSGQDEEGMLRALREIVATDVGLPIHAGVNRGHVFTGDIGGTTRRTYAVMGDAVNLAARLTARAQPGAILATADVLDRAKTIYATEKEPLLVKGKERAVTAHSVGEPVGSREEPETDTTPIVGRERELDALRTAIDSARMRELRVVELVGEPGIGKSRLVRELRTLALGFTQLATAAQQYESSTPFFPWRNVLRQLAGITPDRSREEAGAQLAPFVSGVMPDLAPWLPLLAIPFDAEVATTSEADALDPASSRDRLHAVVETFLERVLMMPTLLIFEDAHWLDDSSRFLLRHLTEKPAPRPWLVCVTTRPSGETSVHLDGPVERVELQPLEAAQATELALAAADEVAIPIETFAALIQRSGGNPLFVQELVNAALAGDRFETLPESVESLLTTRIDTLDPVNRMLLRYASVVGPTFELDFLAEVLEDEIPDAADPARWEWLREFVMYAGDMTYTFRHDLIRATAYEGLSFRRRSEIHGRVARALEARAGDRVDETAGLLSRHFFEAGDHAKAWRYAVAAGDRAHATFANVVAAELYERAIAAEHHLPDVAEREVARVLEALGDVCERFGAYSRARAAYERVIELLPDDPILETRLYAKRGSLNERVGEYEEAFALYQQGLERLDALPADDELMRNRTEIEICAAGVRYRQGQFKETLRWAKAAATHAEQTDDRGRLAHAYYLMAAGYNELGRPDGIAYCEQALPIYEELSDFGGMGRTLNTLGIRLYYEGRWDEAVEAYRRGREALERAGDVVGEATLANNEGEVLSDQGRLDEAAEPFQQFVRVCKAVGYPLGEGAAVSNLARLEARAGRFEEAHDLFAQALAIFERIGAARLAAEARARHGECLVFEGSHAEAIALLDGRVDDEEADPVSILVERTLGYALHQARRPDEGAPHFEESLRIARELKAEYELALTLRAMAATRYPSDEDLAAESDAILERLGVVSVPSVPLP
jgi:class 3 adenylate cyclase/tetratricopeptide (TPR) repeat protein